jgi:hypothetical protein
VLKSKLFLLFTLLEVPFLSSSSSSSEIKNNVRDYVLSSSQNDPLLPSLLNLGITSQKSQAVFICRILKLGGLLAREG